VQEYIPGMTLSALIRQGHRFSLSYTFDIIVQLLTLLKQLHGHTPPVIHRDIKPSNIMLKPFDKDGYKVYLIDFGAVANPQLQSGGSTVAGTYGFMPPEQLMGKPVPASDVYAVAAVAVNLITGISPADMPVKDFHLIFEPQMQFMPVNVVNILRQMLEPDIENRLCDYDVLIETFTRFRGGNYDTANDILQHSSNAEYEKQLKAVESYAQPGNIELWQRLPDKTPRDMPQIYQELFNTIEKNNIKKKLRIVISILSQNRTFTPINILTIKRIMIKSINYF
jgi:serine/threonine protein kinase